MALALGRRSVVCFPFAVNLIHNYLYKEIIFLALAVIGVLTFLLVAIDLFKVIELLLYTDLSPWITIKFVLLLIPFVLTLTIPAGLLAAVLIVFGRLSSDRELLAIKAAGVGLAPIVAPVVVLAFCFSLVDLWLITLVNPECRKEYNGMKHEIVTSNPMALFNPEMVIDKIPGWRIFIAKKDGNVLYDVLLWKLDGDNHLSTSLRADRARVDLDQEHQQLVMTLFNERQETYPSNGDPTQVVPGTRATQLPIAVSLNSFYEKVERKLAWMTLPEIEDVLFAMQNGTDPSQEEATPYLTEFQARISFSLACFTFVIVGIPLAIQTQRRETSVGVALTIVIVGLYMLLEAVGRALKAKAGLYPELIIWAPNLIFQFVGGWLFYRANRK